jgi:hypothetical protein
MCSRVLWTSEGQPILVGGNWDFTDAKVNESTLSARQGIGDRYADS